MSGANYLNLTVKGTVNAADLGLMSMGKTFVLRRFLSSIGRVGNDTASLHTSVNFLTKWQFGRLTPWTMIGLVRWNRGPQSRWAPDVLWAKGQTLCRFVESIGELPGFPFVATAF